MHESSLQYICCVKCSKSLELETFEEKNEIIEGLLTCVQCNGTYPIIMSIPILVEDLSLFLSVRAKLGGYLLLNTKNPKIKSLIKKSLKNIKKIEVSSDPSEGVAVILCYWAGQLRQCRRQNCTLRISDPNSAKTWSGDALKIRRNSP